MQLTTVRHSRGHLSLHPGAGVVAVLAYGNDRIRQTETTRESNREGNRHTDWSAAHAPECKRLFVRKGGVVGARGLPSAESATPAGSPVDASHTTG